MDYVGKLVRHAKYGDGRITVQTNDKIKVKFDGEEAEKTFLYPSSLGTYLTYSGYASDLLTVLEEHGFEGFHHYTNFSNFLQIMKEKKLYSRIEAEQKGVLLTDSAENNVIQHTKLFVKNMVRFYYKEDTPTLFRNEGIRHQTDFGEDEHNAHMPIPVLLLFDKKLIFEPKVQVSNGGCGSRNTRITDDLGEALLFDWDGILERGPIVQSTIENNREITNKRNAEFLFPSAVDTDKIVAIVFRCEADKKHAEFILGENELFQVNPNKFTTTKFENRKRTYLKDYTITLEGDKCFAILEFYKSPIGYRNKLIEYFKDGCIKERYIADENIYECYLQLSYDAFVERERIEYLIDDVVCAVWR